MFSVFPDYSTDERMVYKSMWMLLAGIFGKTGFRRPGCVIGNPVPQPSEIHS
jgi:hypothetical protein